MGKPRKKPHPFRRPSSLGDVSDSFVRGITIMGSLTTAVKLFEEFRSAFDAKNCDVEKCTSMLSQLKIQLTELSFLLPNAEERKEEAVLERELLEFATLLAVKKEDNALFQRSFAQLKTYYFDTGDELPESPRQSMILGLNLMRLLAQNRIGEFHKELQLVPSQMQSNVYIKFATTIERALMEGAFAKVVASKDEVPAASYAHFMQCLVSTVRDEIADCSEQAYSSLSTVEAQKILMFSNENDMKDYALLREWKVENGAFVFGQGKDGDVDSIPALKLINRSLDYAKELDRIV